MLRSRSASGIVPNARVMSRNDITRSTFVSSGVWKSRREETARRISATPKRTVLEQRTKTNAEPGGALDVVAAVDKCRGGARVLHLVGDDEHRPGERNEAERLRLEKPDEGERGEERDDVAPAVADGDPGRAAHDAAVEPRVVLRDDLGEVLRLARPADHERVPSLVRSTSRPTRKTKRVFPTT